MITVALVGFEALRGLLRLMLLAFCWHLVGGAIAARRGKERRWPSPQDDELPLVTVQLPMRNEYHVAERVIDHCCAFDYPRDRLEIQVLDDSDDATASRVADQVAARAAAGHPIALLHRDRPDEYKAGALNAGLAQARGELVAIFDADCMPAPDFLRQTVPCFEASETGFVQVRWEFTNREASLLSRVQALVLDGLFAVEQYVRAADGQPVQFNGTNGVWRRRCLEEAGSWSGGSLTEDVDLSFRAYLRGWRAVHCRDYAVPTEIPESMAVFRMQQRRWATGSAQSLRRLAGELWRAPLGPGVKLSMLMHLCRHAVYPLIVLTCVMAPLTTLYRMPFLVDYGLIANSILVGAILLSMTIFYGVSQRALGRPGRRLVWLPFIVLLAIGMSVVYTSAFLRGLVQRGGAFLRTPKQGNREPEGAEPRYRADFDPSLLVEVVLGGSQLYFAARAMALGMWAYGAFFAAVGVSFLWVGLGSMRRPGG